MDQTSFNQQAWDAIARSPRKWFVPVTPEQVAAARLATEMGEAPKIKVTATLDVPQQWLGDVSGKKILCLAGGGGHQAPLLAAAGANVTVADISEGQLEIDQMVAQREGLDVKTVQCDMRDLGDIGDFDIVVNPCSTNFCSDVPKVWQEAFRVLVPGGYLIAGVIQPVNFLFCDKEMLHGRFVVKNSIPFEQQPSQNSELLSDENVNPVPLEFGHSLEDLVGGQLRAGFRMTDMFEDRWGDGDPLSDFIAVFAATRCQK